MLSSSDPASPHHRISSSTSNLREILRPLGNFSELPRVSQTDASRDSVSDERRSFHLLSEPLKPEFSLVIGMAPAILVATLQSTVLTLCSLLIARFLTSSPPPDIPSLLLYTIISTPPNFLWQQYIESKFPGYKLQKIEVDDGGKGVEVEKALDARNTLVKIGLDQTIGAVVNVTAYIGGTRALRGVPLVVCWDVVKEVGAQVQSLG